MASKKTGTKKTGTSKSRLPDGMKTAFMIAANEIFFENVEAAVDNPRALLKSGDIGATYQDFHRGVLDEKGAAKVLVDLAPWLTPRLVSNTLAKVKKGLSAADFGCDLVDAAALAASIEIAEAILQLAIGNESAVNERVKPWLEPIQKLATRLEAKIEANDTDEDEEIAGTFE